MCYLLTSLFQYVFPILDTNLFDSYQRPVLACAFQDPIHVWSGCLDGKLKSFDINSNQESVIGMHENTIRCIEFSNEINAVRDFLSI